MPQPASSNKPDHGLSDSFLVALSAKAFAFLADAFADQSTSAESWTRKFAAGIIAYSLHNVPGQLHYGREHGPVIRMDSGPPEVIRLVDRFFDAPPLPLPLPCPARELPDADAALTMAYRTFLFFRGFWQTSSRDLSVHDVLSCKDIGGLAGQIPAGGRLAIATRRHFLMWTIGNGFDTDAYLSDAFDPSEPEPHTGFVQIALSRPS